jgi:hypothetical protein
VPRRTRTIRVFRYLEDRDAFVATPEYLHAAELLGIAEWNPVVWIGRLFTLDNDFGEHWFDNWDLREAKGLSEEFFIIDPRRFVDGSDGPCHPLEVRKMFWTDVLRSLELSIDLLVVEARLVNDRRRGLGCEVINDLEQRIETLLDSLPND